MSLNQSIGKPSFYKGGLFFVLFFVVIHGFAQTVKGTFRADFTAKEEFTDGAISLNKGSISYTTNPQKLEYNISFPTPQKVVIQDSVMSIYQNGVLTDSKPYPSLLSFSIFHLILTAQLQDYGLSETPFVIVESKKENGVILSRWEIPYKVRSNILAYELASQDGKMKGIISLDGKENVVSKQVFSDYIEINGYHVPTKSMEIRYFENGSHKKLTTYTNVTLEFND